MFKAYIVSTVNGTIQIGDTCFQPCTGQSFKASRKGLKGKPVYEVSEKSMEAAKQAIQLHSFKES